MNHDLQFWVLIFQTLILSSAIATAYLLFTHHRDPKIYWSLGKNIASVFVIVEVLLLLSWNAVNTALVMGLLHFLAIGLAVMCGLKLLRKLKKPGFIFLSPNSQAIKWRKKLSFLNMLLSVVIAGIFICTFTYILFQMTSPQVSSLLQRTESALGNAKESAIPKSVLLFFLLVAFYEEIIFRFFFQSIFRYLFRKISYASLLAVALTSLIFAVGHFGILDTWWIKFTQTFVVGVVLGTLMNTYGLEASFIAHAILNIFALYASKYLLPN